ncbi:MAG: serpin family protein [Bacteroidales bacterium]|nr:serpin family protein [Bacteroidales bacterium]
MVRNIKSTDMKIRFVLVALTAVFLMNSCGPKYTKPVEASQTGFAISFLRSVSDTTPASENVVVSPYSAAVALSMLAEGAEGQTRTEIDNALGGILYKAEDLGGNDTVIVKSSNSMWIDDNFSPRNRYVSLLEKEFDAFLDVENFADPASVKAINNWCSEHTDGQITEIIDRLSPSTIMVLINALYFNAPWETEFDPELTTDQTFNGLSKKSEVKMMSNKGYYMYAEHQGFQIIQLPYLERSYAMYVVLPPEGADMNRLLSKMDASAYSAAMDLLSQQQVRLLLPKFKVETSMLLNDPLQKMGIKTAFTSAADFSGIAEMGPLVLDQVKQKCYMDVSEKGTEAAAVTSVQIRLTSARPVQKVPVMRVDRPFFFVIADGDNEKILFAGKIVNL